ncbi:MAG TPA: hypothetical protein VK327_04260 [Candidatus Paceibacterota bacterium]|nr:hypothetical protein [Candidatus Paceibacterota bacterium]
MPEFFDGTWTRKVARQQRLSGYLNQYPRYFPDRLSEPRWQERCRITGLEQVLSARKVGRPVVLVFCHFGPYSLLRAWLRASGIPSAVVFKSAAETRPTLVRLADRFIPFPEVPILFSRSELREVTEFLAAGNVLLMAMDVPGGKQMALRVADEWRFEIASGAVRMAIHHQAELIPCSIIDEGEWRYRVDLGRAVPRELLTAESDWIRAGQHLLDEMLPHIKAHPEQCSTTLCRCFKRSTAAQTILKADSAFGQIPGIIRSPEA